MKIRAKRCWTAGWDTVREDVTVEVEDGVIANVEIGAKGPVEVETDLTMLPGLIDSHEHIGIEVGDEKAQAAEDAGEVLLRGAQNLRTILEWGVTTVRDCGERVDVEHYWADALKRGKLSGPRVIRSVTPICRSGGHCWYMSRQADGPDALRAAVRQNVRDGADFIKVMVTGGLSTANSQTLASEYTAEELRVVIDEAHRLGRKVAGHGYGGEGVDFALDAGIDSLEHGALLSAEQLERMAKQGTFLVITTSAVGETDPSIPPAIREVMAKAYAKYQGTISLALKTGVKIALGSDCVHGRIDREILKLVDCGATPVQALEAATARGSELLGREDIGHIRVGAVADFVFVSGDPITNPDVMSSPRGVMQAGEWVGIMSAVA
jgi:imidazolonepropionase-like amidohydrolase